MLVGVAQAREFEFVANNPGDWVLHYHMFHHMMNHMVSGVGLGSRTMATEVEEDPRYKIPAFPPGAGMMALLSPSQAKRVQANPRTRGMRPRWFMGVHGLHTVIRVLLPELYDKVISGRGEIPLGARVPGAKPGHGSMMHHGE